MCFLCTNSRIAQPGEESRGHRARIFLAGPTDRKFYLNIKRKPFTVRVKHRSRLPRKGTEQRFSKPSGASPGQSALVDLALSRGLDQNISRDAIQLCPCFDSTTEPNPNLSMLIHCSGRWCRFYSFTDP